MVQWINVLYGAGVGIGLAVWGYVKREQPTEETFDVQKFTQTVLVGAATGGVAAYYNVNFLTAENLLASAGAITVLDWTAKILCRRVFPWIKEKLGI